MNNETVDVTPAEEGGRKGTGLTRRRKALGGVLVGSVMALFVYHYAAYRLDKNEALEAIRRGRWHSFASRGLDPALTDEQREQIQQLEAIGYLAGSTLAPSAEGVTVYDEALAYNGLNLYTSGHDSEAVLMDMEGRVLHTWRCRFLQVWPDYPVSSLSRGYEFWRRAYLYENGDLLAVYGQGYGLVRLDKSSDVVWADSRKYHHDLEVLEDGTIYALSREGKLLPRIHERFPVLEDFINILDSEGNELHKISLLEAAEQSEYKELLFEKLGKGDIFHTNTIEYLDGSLAGLSPLFSKGNVLVAMRELDAIAIVDVETEQVVWAAKGPWKAQHQPTLLDNGHMLIFDNEGLGRRSRVIEFDPLTLETFWSYGDEPSETLYSPTCGSCQPLPNGNILITESDNGRALEVTSDKKVVWEFLNPHRAGENNELIATLFEVVRLGPAFPLDWLDREN